MMYVSRRMLLVEFVVLIVTSFGSSQEDMSLDPRRVSCPSSCICLGNVVDCSKRSLTAVPSSLPVWVETMDLCCNAITSVDERSFYGLDHLSEINLSDNQLVSVNLTSAAQLTTLKLSHNKLRHLPTVGAQSQITHLLLNNNELTDLSLATFLLLRVVDVSHNQLTRLSNGSLAQLTQLHHLFLNHNQMIALEPGVFDSLVSLELLKLNRNKLRRLRKNIFTPLHKLKYLDLERNRIHVLEGLIFQGLESLLSLKLKNNVITELMDGVFWGLTKIQNLDLSHNNITVVKKQWLYGLDSLQQLSLAYNRIRHVELGSWRFCQQLSDLDLRHNSLKVIGDKMFEDLHSLRHLNLANNEINFIADTSFTGLASLQALDLGFNEISWTIEDESSVFDGLSSLTRLVLSHNHIRSVSRRVFTSLRHLRQLHLEHNYISSVQVGSFDTLPDLSELYLNTSSLICDCHVSWFAVWISNNGFQPNIDARCRFPDDLSGLNIVDLKPDKLRCDEYSKPVIVNEPTSQRALRSGNVTLSCELASSNSLPLTISWKKDNEVLPDDHVENTRLPSSDGMVLRTLSQLHIWPVLDTDAGRYQCIATNLLGSSYSVRAMLTVNVFPTFIKTPLNVTVRSGATARLDCAASGTPAPEIALQKDGGDDFPAARERRMHIFPSDEMFFIVDVKADDQGVYTCTARNDAGVITANATLEVLEAPSFARRMENRVSIVGDTTVLECMTSGSPKPQLTWLKDGVSLMPTLRHFLTADDQLLVIVQTEASDAGDYTCIMSNALGSDRQTSRLVVLQADVTDNAALSGVTSYDVTTTTGIIVIAVVICVVGTSVIWVIVIYKTRTKRLFNGSGYEPGCHRRNGTLLSASETDGSAQRLLACSSSHGDNSFANLKYRDFGFGVGNSSPTTPYMSCRLHTAAMFSEDGNTCHGHSYCLVSGHHSLPVNQDWSDSGTRTIDSSVTDNTSMSVGDHSASSPFKHLRTFQLLPHVCPAYALSASATQTSTTRHSSADIPVMCSQAVASAKLGQRIQRSQSMSSLTCCSNKIRCNGLLPASLTVVQRLQSSSENCLMRTESHQAHCTVSVDSISD